MRRLLLTLSIAALAADASLADVDLSPDAGLRIRGDDYGIHLGGRLHLDYAWFDDDRTPIDDDFDVRRGRPLLEVTLGDDWKAKLEYDFASRDGWRSAWVRWDGIDHLRVRLGNQTMPFGLEEQASSNALVFNERSLASALAPSFGTGLVVSGHGKLVGRSRFTLAGGVYVEPFGDDGDDRHESEHLGLSGRATFAPIARRRSVVQIGASVDWRDIGGGDGWSVSRRPESQLAPALLRTDLSEVANTMTWGTEAAAMFGPLLFQAEYTKAAVDRKRASLLPNVDFDGAYAQLSWVITGERHRYARSLATFGGVRPRRDWGALELGVRWSTLDLNDAGVLGGDAEDISVGLSWWIREYARLVFNYVNVDARLPGTLESDDPQVFGLRFIYHL